MMAGRSITRWVLIIICGLVLAGCGQKTDMAGETVRAYLQALVDGDSDRMVSLTCSDFQSEAMLEFDSFQGVKPSLDNVVCTQSGTDGDTILVTCSGKILATYGNEVQEFDLSNQTYRVDQDGQEWLICGRD